MGDPRVSFKRGCQKYFYYCHCLGKIVLIHMLKSKRNPYNSLSSCRRKSSKSFLVTTLSWCLGFISCQRDRTQRGGRVSSGRGDSLSLQGSHSGGAQVSDHTASTLTKQRANSAHPHFHSIQDPFQETVPPS